MYSQNNEEEIILRVFGDKVGRFLDIGACDGITNSNTLALVERCWSGVLVEPSPGSFMALEARHGKNPKLKLVHAAVGACCGLTEFWDSPITFGYDTTERSNRNKWDHLAKFRRPYFVPTILIEQLLATFGNSFDFISIDTEGTSAGLFGLLPLTIGLRPRVICVEHDGHFSECLGKATAHGYREISRNAENLIFERVDT